MSIQNEVDIIENYGKRPAFASFLPGIAGIRGVPIWCCYVNRGQGVVSFGVENKDHAIMEFYPAHMAYRNVKRTGFRTFIRKDGMVYEAFSEEKQPHQMCVHKNKLVLSEVNEAAGLKTQVVYTILPEERVGALVRHVTVSNCGSEAAEIQVLDGMPELIPYGVNMDSMKNMTQTSKAWMQVENADINVPYYRVRASMADSAAVHLIEGGNFAFAVDETGTKLRPVVDTKALFAYDDSLANPVNFEEGGLNRVYEAKQNTSNLLPCAFFGTEKTLQPGESMELYELIGQVESKEMLLEYLKKDLTPAYFQKKEKRAEELTEELCEGIATKTASKSFDAYCKYTYMDNVLRGGYPIHLGNNKVFYVYSRKHGDLERDYNYFSMLPEYYSQGNGNYRDVNQNRRCDTFFAPFVGTRNLHTFYDLIQLDGYNPLGVEKSTYQLDADKVEVLTSDYAGEIRKRIHAFTEKPFTPGALYMELEALLPAQKVENMFTQMIDFAEETVNGSFIEGYWSDHWTYNLDLILEYLSIFPDREKEMLYEQEYTWFLSQANVNRRAKRYEVTESGVRQYHALDEDSRRSTAEKLVRDQFGKGEVVRATLLEKLILLCTVKFATLDPYGMGIEMEGGKPGWYDALNGLPGIFGSAMTETYELERMLQYTIGALTRYSDPVALPEELCCFMEELKLIHSLEQEHIREDQQILTFWNRINDAKEIYRDKTYAGISGKKVSCSTEKLRDILAGWKETVEIGISKAKRYGEGQIPAYFSYEVTEYTQNEEGVMPLNFRVCRMPEFLEGPVRYLKTNVSPEEKRRIYKSVRQSDLYDEKLSMYKVNASLQEAGYELGRARAFTPGWLENESIWLHMEYKYLLELLRSGLYEEFAEDFGKAAIPFLNEDTYGRSILENSSFIASSKNPDESIHGRGFVARLSGSTIEFISMWKTMFFGDQIFTISEGELCCEPKPALPEYLIPEDGIVKAAFLSGVQMTYHFRERRSYYPGSYRITTMVLTYANGVKARLNGSKIKGQQALDLRSGQIVAVEAEVEPYVG